MAKNYSITTPTDREIDVTWVVDAPRDLVYKAYTDPKLIVQWWGPRNLRTTVDKMDVRPGGAWRYTQRGPDGKEYAFNGEYREVVPPERISQNFQYEALPGHVSVDTATFENQNGKTKVTTKSVFQNVQDRDGMLQSGMEEGMAESIDRLAELMRDMQKGQPGA